MFYVDLLQVFIVFVGKYVAHIELAMVSNTVVASQLSQLASAPSVV